jgi:hypothetical protein
MSEATKRKHIEGKTADDCEDCAHLGKGSYCRYPERFEPEKEFVQLDKSDVILSSRKIGPYRSGEEERFKQDYIRASEALGAEWSYFCIESPGTAAGFPDVIALNARGNYRLIEFKVSDYRGVIHFQNTQPLFYRKNGGLDIKILAWNVPMRRAEVVPASKIVAGKALFFRLSKE